VLLPAPSGPSSEIQHPSGVEYPPSESPRLPPPVRGGAPAPAMQCSAKLGHQALQLRYVGLAHKALDAIHEGRRPEPPELLSARCRVLGEALSQNRQLGFAERLLVDPLQQVADELGRRGRDHCAAAWPNLRLSTALEELLCRHEPPRTPPVVSAQIELQRPERDVGLVATPRECAVAGVPLM